MTVSTAAGTLSRHVADLSPVSAEASPTWLRQLDIPYRWRLARFDGSVDQPARMAVCGAHASSIWDGCETVGLFRFAGTPPPGLIPGATERMLCDLHVQAITTHALAVPPDASAEAVRSNGHFSASGQHMWVQYTTYLANASATALGLFIEHTIFVVSAQLDNLSDDIITLSDNVYGAFVDTIETQRTQGMKTGAHATGSAIPHPRKERE